MNTCKYFLHYVAVQLTFQVELVIAQNYVAMNSKCGDSSSAVSEMAEETVHTDGWALNQAAVWKIFLQQNENIALLCTFN